MSWLSKGARDQLQRHTISQLNANEVRYKPKKV